MPHRRQLTLHDHFSSSSSPVASRKQALTRIKKHGTGKNKTRVSPRDDPYSNEESSSDVEKIQFEPEKADVTTEDEDVQPTSPMKSQMTHRTIIDSTSELEESSEDEPHGKGVGIRWLPAECKRIARKQILDSDSEGDELSPRKRRKFVKGIRPPSDEDEHDLLDEVEQEHVVETRLRVRSKAKTAFQKNLDKLKRKKTGQSSSISASEDSDEDASGSNDEPFPNAYPDAVTNGSINDLDDDDDFIVLDNERGPAVQLPAAFSMSSHQDLSYHFKTICQYFVHIAIASDKRHDVAKSLQEDEYFSVPFQIVRRKTSGIRDTVASSVWRPEFKKALLTYPDFELNLLDISVLDCDACHMGGRLSTFVGRVSGQPYDKVTFESLDESSDSSEEEVNADEDEIKREFNMGRFCARRSRIFHKFVHWEYALYSALIQEIEELNAGDENSGHFVRIAYARGKKPPKDVTDPDEVMEWLDERGIIAEEWTKFQNLIEASSNLDASARADDDIF